MGKEELRKEESKTGPDISRWYTDNEIIHTADVNGIPMKIREISGEEYTALVERCMDKAKATLDRQKYFAEIVKTCVVEPKGIETKRLKPGPLTAIVQKIEDVLGLSEVVQKNLLNR
jgi:hypothetical protein